MKVVIIFSKIKMQWLSFSKKKSSGNHLKKTIQWWSSPKKKIYWLSVSKPINWLSFLQAKGARLSVSNKALVIKVWRWTKTSVGWAKFFPPLKDTKES